MMPLWTTRVQGIKMGVRTVSGDCVHAILRGGRDRLKMGSLDTYKLYRCEHNFCFGIAAVAAILEDIGHLAVNRHELLHMTG
jgi:hypothetical protein